MRPRVGFRVGHDILDLATKSGSAAVFEASSLNPFLALGRSSWEDTLARIRGPRRLPTSTSCRSRTRRSHAVRRRGLRRLLLVARARDEPRPTLPSRLRSAASELAPPPRRVPRARREPSSSAGRRSCGRAASRRRPGDEAPRFGPSRRLDIELELGFVVGVGEHARRAGTGLGVPRLTSSVSSSSTTGARVTSRPGSTSHSGPSSGSRSRPPSAPGSRRSRSSRTDSYLRPRRIPSRSRTSASRETGRSTSSSRWSSAAPSSRARTRAASTGRCRSSSRTPR